MKEKSTDILYLVRQALKTQVELGLGEVILRRKQAVQTEAKPDVMPRSEKKAVAVDLFGMEHMEQKEELVPQYDSLEAHYAAIHTCRKCPLGETRTKFVYGVGNPHADIMFIGEAPGRDEDLQGEPFVGRAGQLLDKILAAMQLNRQQVYIANILKCRPPNNRDPLPEEAEQCLPHLLQQIALIRPKLICALGRIAGQILLKTSTPLGKLRKRWHEFEGIPLIVTYHPAALLRFPAYKKDTWEDMQELMRRYQELKVGS